MVGSTTQPRWGGTKVWSSGEHSGRDGKRGRRGMVEEGRRRGQAPRIGHIVGIIQMGRREASVSTVVRSGADIHIFSVHTTHQMNRESS